MLQRRRLLRLIAIFFSLGALLMASTMVASAAKSSRSAKARKEEPAKSIALPPRKPRPVVLDPSQATEIPLPPRKAEAMTGGEPEVSEQPAAKGKQKGKAALPQVPPQEIGKDSAEPSVSDEAAVQAVAAAKAECDRLLGSLAIEYRLLPTIREGACGTPQPIEVASLGNKPKVLLSPPATMNCPLAAKLATWLADKLQPLALREFETAIVEIQNGTSYACRNRNGDASGKLSEHAFANAIDIPAFRLADGQSIVVVSGWGDISRDVAKSEQRTEEAKAANAEELPGVEIDPPTTEAAVGSPVIPLPPRKTLGPRVVKTRLIKVGELIADAERSKADAADDKPKPGSKQKSKRRRPQAEARKAWPQPKTPMSRFLHTAHDSACGLFGTVLGPEANDAHRDHLHIDLAYRRSSAFCE